MGSSILVNFPVQNIIRNVLQREKSVDIGALTKTETEIKTETATATRKDIEVCADSKGIDNKEEVGEEETGEEKVEKKEVENELESEINLKRNRSTVSTSSMQLPLLHERISKLTLLRRICQVIGLRIVSRDYDFSSSSPFGDDDIVSLIPMVSRAEWSRVEYNIVQNFILLYRILRYCIV